MFGHLDPANRFAMEGLNMAVAAELHHEGKPLSRTPFLDGVMVEKTQKLIEHINHHQLGLSLTTNIHEIQLQLKCMIIT